MCGRAFTRAFLGEPKEVGRVDGVNSRSDKAENASLGQCRSRQRAARELWPGGKAAEGEQKLMERRLLGRHRGVFWRKLGRSELGQTEHRRYTYRDPPPVLEDQWSTETVRESLERGRSGEAREEQRYLPMPYSALALPFQPFLSRQCIVLYLVACRRGDAIRAPLGSAIQVVEGDPVMGLGLRDSA